jgi:hypothetical protein
VGEYTAGLPDEASVDVEEELRQALLLIPAETVLGQADPEHWFHLVCWNDANCLLEGVGTPSLAARGIANMAR